jgi:hypothetical protein
MTGLLAQTNATIREAERRAYQVRSHREEQRRPIVLIDRLLQDLEELNLRGFKRVPLAFEPRLNTLAALLREVESPAVTGSLENLKVKIGIGRLMDALFAIEEALFVDRHGPSLDEELGSDLIFAA